MKKEEPKAFRNEASASTNRNENRSKFRGRIFTIWPGEDSAVETTFSTGTTNIAVKINATLLAISWKTFSSL